VLAGFSLKRFFSGLADFDVKKLKRVLAKRAIHERLKGAAWVVSA
jgi:hypothetical protein